MWQVPATLRDWVSHVKPSITYEPKLLSTLHRYIRSRPINGRRAHAARCMSSAMPLSIHRLNMHYTLHISRRERARAQPIPRSSFVMRCAEHATTSSPCQNGYISQQHRHITQTQTHTHTHPECALAKHRDGIYIRIYVEQQRARHTWGQIIRWWMDENLCWWCGWYVRRCGSDLPDDAAGGELVSMQKFQKRWAGRIASMGQVGGVWGGCDVHKLCCERRQTRRDGSCVASDTLARHLLRTYRDTTYKRICISNTLACYAESSGHGNSSRPGHNKANARLIGMPLWLMSACVRSIACRYYICVLWKLLRNSVSCRKRIVFVCIFCIGRGAACVCMQH